MEQTQGTKLIASILTPIVDKATVCINEHNTVGYQEVLLEMKEIKIRMDSMMEIMVGNRKSFNTKAEKKTTEATPDEAKKPAGKTNFYANKLFYFKDQFKNDPAYRQKYVDEKLQQFMDADPTIAAKKDAAQKLTAQCQFAWGYIKKENPALMEQIGKEFDEAKKQFESKATPAQETVEPDSP